MPPEAEKIVAQVAQWWGLIPGLIQIAIVIAFFAW